jgi:arylsulfatase A
MADDLGYGDFGCYGATKIATPHCDRLAREQRSTPLREATVCVGSNSLVFSVRQGPWKLLVTANGKYLGDKLLTEPKGVKRSLAEPELFNLAADPYEQHNLATDQPDKFQELATLLAKYREQGYSRPGWHPAN